MEWRDWVPPACVRVAPGVPPPGAPAAARGCDQAPAAGGRLAWRWARLRHRSEQYRRFFVPTITVPHMGHNRPTRARALANARAASRRFMASPPSQRTAPRPVSATVNCCEIATLPTAATRPNAGAKLALAVASDADLRRLKDAERERRRRLAELEAWGWAVRQKVRTCLALLRLAAEPDTEEP